MYRLRVISLGIAAAVVLSLIGGCAQMGYYAQAAHGQFSLLANARPIDDWLADLPANSPLHQKLRQVQQIRQFAARELGLPDNRSYTRYAQLSQPYVLWNIVATGPLSMEQKQWCFPIAGCVSYRGYYNKADAQEYADGLRKAGLDVQVGGVPAYSTLGWFDDPVLSSFIKYPQGELARLVFHELAHQVVYVKDDTQFNESFATAVEEMGVEHWLTMQEDPGLRKAYVEFQSRKEDFLTLLLKHRNALEKNFQRTASDVEKLQRKQEIFLQLKADYQVLKHNWGGYTGYDRWFAEPLSNAHLASVTTYHEFVPAFRALFDQEKSLPRFYAAANRLAGLDKMARRGELANLSRQLRPADTDPSALSFRSVSNECLAPPCGDHQHQ
ncbi:MAG: aminopeptidase [Pseudomonadota bacterium]